MRICRRETFNAAHRLFKAEWSDSKNLEVFGKCSHPYYHGHNYIVEVNPDNVDYQALLAEGWDTDKLAKSTEQYKREHRTSSPCCPEKKQSSQYQATSYSSTSYYSEIYLIFLHHIFTCRWQL